jgi:hypothetical protein
MMQDFQPEQEIDLDLLAALLDGRLSGTERERALRMLSRSEAALAIYADAVRVQADPAVRQVIPLAAATRRRRRIWSVAVPLAAAAALAVFVVPRMLSENERALMVASADVVAPLAGRPDLGIALGDEWDQRNWSVTRGGGPSVHPDTTLAFRFGVRALDLRVALELGNATLADRLTGELLGWLESVEFSELVAADYRRFRGRLAGGDASRGLVDEASRLEGDLGGLLNPFWFGFGKWVGGGELAARAREGAFFDSPLTTRVLNDALESGRFAEQDVGALRQIDALRQDDTSGRYDVAREVFRALIRRHGG